MKRVRLLSFAAFGFTSLGRTCLPSNFGMQGAGGIAGVIRFINGSKKRMTELKHEVAASTSRFRQGYQDENILLSMILEGDGKMFTREHVPSIPSRPTFTHDSKVPRFIQPEVCSIYPYQAEANSISCRW